MLTVHGSNWRCTMNHELWTYMGYNNCKPIKFKHRNNKCDSFVEPNMTYVGCFIDAEVRDLPARLYSHPSNMTNERCAAHCIGYRYFATQVRYVVHVCLILNVFIPATTHPHI